MLLTDTDFVEKCENKFHIKRVKHTTTIVPLFRPTYPEKVMKIRPRVFPQRC